MSKKRDEIVLDALSEIDDLIPLGPNDIPATQPPLIPTDSYISPPATAEEIDFLLPPPTLSVKVERNSKGYNYEVGVSGARTVNELRDSLRDARRVVIEELAEKTEAA